MKHPQHTEFLLNETKHAYAFGNIYEQFLVYLHWKGCKAVGHNGLNVDTVGSSVLECILSICTHSRFGYD